MLCSQTVFFSDALILRVLSCFSSFHQFCKIKKKTLYISFLFLKRFNSFIRADVIGWLFAFWQMWKCFWLLECILQRWVHVMKNALTVLSGGKEKLTLKYKNHAKIIWNHNTDYTHGFYKYTQKCVVVHRTMWSIFHSDYYRIVW